MPNFFKFIYSKLFAGFSEEKELPVVDRRELINPVPVVFSLMKLFKECGLINFENEQKTPLDSVTMSYAYKRKLPNESFAGEDMQAFVFYDGKGAGSFHRAHVGNLFMAAAKSLGIMGSEPETFIQMRNYSFKAKGPEELNLGSNHNNLNAFCGWLRFNENGVKNFIRSVSHVSRQGENFGQPIQASLYWAVVYKADEPVVQAMVFTNDQALYRLMSKIDARDGIAASDVTDKNFTGTKALECERQFIIKVGGMKGMQKFTETASVLENSRNIETEVSSRQR